MILAIACYCLFNDNHNGDDSLDFVPIHTRCPNSPRSTVSLNGKNINILSQSLGVNGTESLLNLAAGNSNLSKYCPETEPIQYMLGAKEAEPLSYRLSLTADFYVNDDNYDIFRHVLEGSCTVHDITVSHFHPVSLGHEQIETISKDLAFFDHVSVGKFVFSTHIFCYLQSSSIEVLVRQNLFSTPQESQRRCTQGHINFHLTGGV